MRRRDRLLGVVVAAGFLAALGALSQVPHTATPADAAEIRLAWRARVPRVEECRRLTEAEQAELPVHMRREEVCEGRVASYRLEVEVGGRTVRSAVVSGSGARGDRPLYVFERIPVGAGVHELGVSFTRVGVGSGARTGGGEGVPDRLVLRERVELGPRDVVLVVYAEGRRSLEVRPVDARE